MRNKTRISARLEGLFLAAIFVVVGSWAKAASSGVEAAAPVRLEVLETRRIWDAAAHNAFTDLIHWRGTWWCTFRESAGHVGGDGAIRVLSSRDGVEWVSAAYLVAPGADLRDPKFSVTPQDRLMINCGSSFYEGKKLKGRVSLVMFSDDGLAWTKPVPVVGPNEWLWRVTWHDGVAYGAAYDNFPQRQVASWSKKPDGVLKLYRSTDGIQWKPITRLRVEGRPNETTLRFTSDGKMLALVRREDPDDPMGFVGTSAPPYKKWQWSKSNYRFGGQNAIQLTSGEWVVGTRDYSQMKVKGSWAGAASIVAQLGDDGRLAPLVTLPSGGDCSYPGMVQIKDQVWISYYSSHEGKAAIYLAKLRVL